MLLAVAQLGSVAQWLTIVAVTAAGWRLSRGGAGSAVQELSAANKVLEHRKEELGAQVRDLLVENAALKQRTDFQAVMSGHEERAQQRNEAILHVLELIADRLGPDNNDGAPHARAA